MNLEVRRTAIEDVFVGDSEMARLMRAHDWERSSLGPVAQWPQALKVAIRLLLTSRFEMWLGWGPDVLFFYNDAYRPTLGQKHPRSLAMPTRELYAEIWADVEPRLRVVYDQGESTWDKALLLMLNRNGYLEETYHTFSYSPLYGDGNRVEGVFCAVSEDTDRVLTERRLASLGSLATRLNESATVPQVGAAAAAALAENPFDLPFALLYHFEGDGDARLLTAVGTSPGTACAPELIPAGATTGPWALDGILRGGGGDVVRCGADLPRGAWDKSAGEALVVPVVGQGSERPIGALVTGLNPYRPLDAAHRSFVHLVAGQIAASLASAEVTASERRRAEALADAVALRQAAADALRLANEQLASEVALRTRENERLRDLFGQAPGFMCVLEGPQHVYTLVNEAYGQLVGHRRLLGMTVREGLPELQGQGYYELLDQVYASGEPFVGSNLPVMLQRTPGAALEQRFVNLVYQPIRDASGQVQGIFAEGYDTTHQKRTEDALQALNENLEQRVSQRTAELADALSQLQTETEQRETAQEALRHAQRMEALGQLTGGVAHDFNNLLQVIGGNLQLLGREVAGNERAENRLGSALKGVSRGAKLASQLLSFGRRQPLEPKVLNIGRFIRGMDDMMRRTLGEEIDLETVVGGGLWNALLDPSQIENAVLNLAINARDAMEGGGRLTVEASNAMLDDEYVRLHDDVRAGQYVLLAVTDTGTGMPAGILDRVFEPFFSTKPEGKGTGLGLSMVYGFVKQSGGHVKLYSELGQGTTVKLYFPRVLEAEDERVVGSAAPVHGGDETVLVVEDDDEVRETAVGLLTDLGYRVLKARDAASAYAVIDSGVAVDLLFTDVVMPGPMRSPELARKAREKLPRLAVLFTSGYTENAIVHGGRLDAGVELLSKPYSREALARKVRHVLANQALRMPAPAPQPATGVRRLGCVLVVEDDEAVRAGIADMVRDHCDDVVEAADADEALHVLSARHIDALLTDVGLPKVSGVELARRARERHPGLPVAFLTGDGRDPAIATVPFAAVLMKPFFPEDLERTLRRLLPAMPRNEPQ